MSTLRLRFGSGNDISRAGSRHQSLERFLATAVSSSEETWGDTACMAARECSMTTSKRQSADANSSSTHDYDYVLTLNDAELAWEFLRRNPEYQQDYHAARIRRSKPRRHASTLVWRRSAEDAGARRWGLCSFRRPILGRP
jgi:hypothetical protein